MYLSATHPAAKCPKTAANLKVGLIISDLVTDALVWTPTEKSLCSGHNAGVLL